MSAHNNRHQGGLRRALSPMRLPGVACGIVLGALAVSHSVSPAHATMIPMTQEAWEENAVFLRCIALLDKAREASKRTAATHTNIVAGFVAGNVIDPAFASEYEKVRERYLHHHEFGHCKDREMALRTDWEGNYRYYLGESYADSYSTLKVYQEGATLEALRQFSDLRAISQVLLPLGGHFNDDMRWSRYHTTPAVDHTIAWIEENGSGLAGLDDDALFALAQDLVGEVALTQEQHDAMTATLLETRVVAGEEPPEGSSIAWSAALAPDTARRLEGALARMDVTGSDIARYLASASVVAAE